MFGVTLCGIDNTWVQLENQYMFGEIMPHYSPTATSPDSAITQVCVAVCCSLLCSLLQCVAVCCSVLRGVAVCCSVLQCVAKRCSVLQCVV